MEIGTDRQFLTALSKRILMNVITKRTCYNPYLIVIPSFILLFYDVGNEWETIILLHLFVYKYLNPNCLVVETTIECCGVLPVQVLSLGMEFFAGRD